VVLGGGGGCGGGGRLIIAYIKNLSVDTWNRGRSLADRAVLQKRGLMPGSIRKVKDVSSLRDWGTGPESRLVTSLTMEISEVKERSHDSFYTSIEEGPPGVRKLRGV